MEKKKFRFILLTALFLIINVAIVYAQGTLDPMFRGLANMGLLESINQYPMIWDAIIFLTLFIGLGKKVFEKQFNPKAGGMIGFAFSIIALSGEYTLGFSVTRDFGPWLLLIAIVGLLIFVVKLFVSGGENKAGKIGIATFLFITLLLNAVPFSRDFIIDKSPLLYSLLMLFQMLGMIFGGMYLFRLVSNIGPATPGNAMNTAANTINGLADGGRNLRDAWRNARGQPNQNDLITLTAEIDDFDTEIVNFRRAIGELQQSYNDLHNHRTNGTTPDPNQINRTLSNMQTLRTLITSLNNQYLTIQRNGNFVNLGAPEQTKFNSLRDSLINPGLLLDEATTVLADLAGLGY